MISMGHHHGPGGKRQGGPPQKLDGKTRKRVIARLLTYIIKYWPLFISAIALTLFSNQLALLGPKFSGLAIDALSAESGVNFNAVWENVFKMIFCYAIAGITSYALSISMTAKYTGLYFHNFCCTRSVTSVSDIGKSNGTTISKIRLVWVGPVPTLKS